ncbi:hypothetical protein BZA77DRAFT_292096 [Pyronema omphalodes]|nr:hypothetical protein BZA77DRAFT_292096 [Pyronema omphalodes]
MRWTVLTSLLVASASAAELNAQQSSLLHYYQSSIQTFTTLPAWPAFNSALGSAYATRRPATNPYEAIYDDCMFIATQTALEGPAKTALYQEAAKLYNSFVAARATATPDKYWIEWEQKHSIGRHGAGNNDHDHDHDDDDDKKGKSGKDDGHDTDNDTDDEGDDDGKGNKGYDGKQHAMGVVPDNMSTMDPIASATPKAVADSTVYIAVTATATPSPTVAAESRVTPSAAPVSGAGNVIVGTWMAGAVAIVAGIAML